MSNELANRYFHTIKKTWAPFSSAYRIIPFCTSVFEQPTAILIGTNHSDFVEGGGELSERIADDLANNVPNQNTFLIHQHRFACGVREVCKRAGIKIDHTWIGTNRCAVQTGSKGIGEIEKHYSFGDCQITMDRILLDFLAETRPKNLILVGKYASTLYYPRAVQSTFDDLHPRDIKFEAPDSQMRIIPIQHPSRPPFWQPAADRLAEYFVR